MQMRFLAAVILFAATVSSSFAFAQNAESLLKRDLMAGMRTMPKTVRMYHYFNAPIRNDGSFYSEFLTSQGREQYVSANYLRAVAGRFWDPNYLVEKYVNAGPGVYFAIDPHISSKDFGRTMIEMEIPAGTRFLNVVKAIPIAKDTLAALISEKIILPAQASKVFFPTAGPTRLGFYRDTLKIMTLDSLDKDPNLNYRRFRSLVSQVFQSMALEFIEFNWNTSLTGFCTKTGSFSAFNYIGLQPYAPRYRAQMTSPLNFPDLSATEQELAARVGKFRDVLTQLDLLKKRGMKVPKDFALRYYTPAEYQQIKSMTFGCD